MGRILRKLDVSGNAVPPCMIYSIVITRWTVRVRGAGPHAMLWFEPDFDEALFVMDVQAISYFSMPVTKSLFDHRSSVRLSVHSTFF